jgi:RHS repeat-associated protein
MDDLYDGQMPVMEQEFKDGVLKQTRIHLLGARGIEGIITLPSNGAPTLNWLFYDGHGNMVRTMNTAFALSGFQWRGVWGERTTSTPGRGYCANLGHPEDETGLVYMRARYYEPTTGRFISEDPARDGGNWYLYADGDPVNKVDADGSESEWEWYVLGVATSAMSILFGYVIHSLAKPLEVLGKFPRLDTVSAVILSFNAAFFAGVAVYAFMKALGGLSSEIKATLQLGGLFATSFGRSLLNALDGLGTLAKGFGGFGMSAATWAAGFMLATTAALLLSEAF